MDSLTTFAPNSSAFEDTSLLLSSNITASLPRSSHGGLVQHIVLNVVYAIGIIGNTAAIIILRRGERRVRNRKHLLLLTSLAANDLVAMVGMMCCHLLTHLWPSFRTSQAHCMSRVVLRVFGIGSVCIAVTMALERYLALTRPFLYQKQVTYYVISCALLVSWSVAAILTCAPIAGWGLYYSVNSTSSKIQCERYRNALMPSDLAYAWVYVAFGTLLCAVLVYCNLAVIRALYAISTPKAGADPVVRRVSKSSCRQRSVKLGGAVTYNAATVEEVAFSRLMATLSVLFMICWMPQMITSTLYLTLSKEQWGRRLYLLGSLSDMLMLLNYVLDPVLYVLMRRTRFSINHMCRSIAHCFKKRNHRYSDDSGITCCPQETLLSDSGAELRQLRSSHVPTADLVKIQD